MEDQLIRLSLDKLKPGMYVAGLACKSRPVELVTPGRVEAQSTIDTLRARGVVEVLVDPSLSTPPQLAKVEASQPSAASSSDDCRKPTPLSAELRCAKRLITESKKLVGKLLKDVQQGVALELEPLQDLAGEMINSITRNPAALQCVSAIRSKDAYLLEHSINVGVLLGCFGRHLDLDRQTQTEILLGGLIHDLGKIHVKDTILHKPTRLTETEFAEMKKHPLYSEEILAAQAGLPQICLDVALMHHERLDGLGYPRGLKGEAIPLHGRMSAIVDIYDALTASRCYKEAMSPAKAFKILLEQTPTQLDQTLVHRFIRCIGFYPVGSVVELSDGRVGIVWENRGRKVDTPLVKCFYNLKHQHYSEVTFLDLAKSKLKIERSLEPSRWGFDPDPFR